MSKQLLHIENLSFGHKFALTEPFSISVDRGEFICIIGRNGEGKSTLLNTISGLLAPISGKISYNNKPLKSIKLRERSSIFSYVPSKQEYLSNLKVIELVEMGRSPYTNIFDKKSEKDKNIITKAIINFDLEKLRDKPLFSISDGERQRAMICRAFVQETSAIFLDEPTAFLDYYAKSKLITELHTLAVDNDKCIIFSSHDLDIALKFADKIWLIHENKVKQYAKQELSSSKILKEIMNFEFNE